MHAIQWLLTLAALAMLARLTRRLNDQARRDRRRIIRQARRG